MTSNESPEAATGRRPVSLMTVAPSRPGRDHQHQFVGIDGLADVGLEPGRECPSAVVRPDVGGEGHGRHPRAPIRRKGPDAAYQLVAVRAGHRDVGDQHVGNPARERLERLVRRRRRPHFGAAAGQDPVEHVTILRFILHDQDAYPVKAGRARCRDR